MFALILTSKAGNVSKLRQAFRNSTLFHWYKKISAPGEYAWWRIRGSPGVKAPHLTKQRAIEQYAREYNLHVLVETGTNYGHMIYVNKDRFREIYSIELDPWRARAHGESSRTGRISMCLKVTAAPCFLK